MNALPSFPIRLQRLGDQPGKLQVRGDWRYSFTVDGAAASEPMDVFVKTERNGRGMEPKWERAEGKEEQGQEESVLKEGE